MLIYLKVGTSIIKVKYDQWLVAMGEWFWVIWNSGRGSAYVFLSPILENWGNSMAKLPTLSMQAWFVTFKQASLIYFTNGLWQLSPTPPKAKICPFHVFSAPKKKRQSIWLHSSLKGFQTADSLFWTIFYLRILKELIYPMYYIIYQNK